MSHLKWMEVKMMDIRIKFYRGMANLKRSVEYTYSGEVPSTEEEFNKIKWLQDNGEYTTTNPHSELTWDKVNAEMDRLQTEYDAQDYARNRQVEYPATTEFLEAYTEKEIGGDSTKWDAYVVKYNKVRSDVPKP